MPISGCTFVCTGFGDRARDRNPDRTRDPARDAREIARGAPQGDDAGRSRETALGRRVGEFVRIEQPFHITNLPVKGYGTAQPGTT
jgi:hypothetical protein